MPNKIVPFIAHKSSGKSTLETASLEELMEAMEILNHNTTILFESMKLLSEEITQQSQALQTVLLGVDYVIKQNEHRDSDN